MLVGLDGRDIGWDCMVLKLLSYSLVVVCYLTTFTCWTNFMHNFIRHMVVSILYILTQLVGSHTGWTITLKGVYGTLCARCILHDTSLMAVWGIVTNIPKKGGGERGGFFPFSRQIERRGRF